MRKYIIAVAVFIVFVAYSLVLRHQHSGPVIAPSTSGSTTASSGSGTPSKSSSSSTSGTSSGSSSTSSTASYKDGTYTGSAANAYYGNVQVAITVSGGKITAVNFLQSPNENPNSVYVNQQADPYLKQETITAQSANISSITGATLTSQAFIQSLSSALSQAQA